MRRMPAALPRSILPFALLAVILALMLGSSWNDSAIIDELAHVPAGYAYVFLRDYRLNPEHPPLIKMLAALPLAFTDLNFPTNAKSWTEDINGQWTQGAIFLYESGNNPDTILRLMRLPLMGLAVLFGWMLFVWTRRHFDDRVALLTLFFYAFSPTFITHSRFVTTDLGAAFGFFIGIAAFLAFLRDPTPRSIIIAGLALGAAQLLKFSLILLVPVWAVLLVAWAASQTHRRWSERMRLFLALLIKIIAIAAVAVVLIWIVYAYTVWNYPADRQYRDAEFILESFRFRSWVTFDLWLIAHDFLRPLGQYVLGLFMVLQRAAGGNTQYFLGEVSAAGDVRYFPVLYLLKEPLALHILSAIALWFALRRIWSAPEKSLAAALAWIRDHFIQFSAIAFIAIYWLSSLSSSLNIGVRHVLPTFPFIFLLVSKEIVAWLRGTAREGEVTSWWDWLRRIYRIYIASIPRYLVAYGLIAWMAVSVIIAFPHYLSYYNELAPLAARSVRAAAPTLHRDLPLRGRAGGTDRGYLIGVDSNYDWGQDLKRLRDFVETNGIQKIAVDYFGGGSPAYYLGEKFEPWSSAKGYPSELGRGPSTSSGQTPEGVWFAVSATFQMGAYGQPVKGFIRKPEDSYEWLKPFRPVARAGKSIFIYQLP